MLRKGKERTGLAVFVALIAATVFVFAGCPTDTEDDLSGTGRGAYQTHQKVIGYSEVTLDKSGKVTTVTLDDYFDVNSWTAIADANVPADLTDTVKIGNSNYPAKIKIGDEVFTLDPNTTTASYNGKVLGKDVKDITNWFTEKTNRTQAEYLWYIDACRSKNLAYLKADGTPSATKPSYTSSNKTTETMSKSETGYWTVTNGLGWTGNKEKIVAFAKSQNVGYSQKFADDLVGANKDTIADATAGATASDTGNYLKTILLARNAVK